MQVKQILTILLLYAIVIISVNSITALDGLGYTEKNTNYSFCQVCADSTYITLSSITTPTQIINVNDNMTSVGIGQYCYNYTFLENGRYDFKGVSDGCDKTFATYIIVTENGNEPPSGIVIVLFILFFLLIIGFFIYELLISIGHLASLDLDVIDLAKSLGLYFALFALYMVGLMYLGNPDFNSWLLLIIQIGAFTHVILPITGFLISITIGSLKKKEVDFGTRRLWRRQRENMQ